MGPHLRVGVDVGARSHSVGIADSEGRILEEFTIPHSQEGFQEFFARIERHRQKGNLPVEVAMEGLNGRGRPLDGLILEADEPLVFAVPLLPGRPLGALGDRQETPTRVELPQGNSRALAVN